MKQLLILLAALAAASAVPVFADPAPPDSVYHNSEWGYAFRCPDGWTGTLDIENRAGRAEKVVRQRMTFRGPGGAAIYVSVWENIGGDNIEEWFRNFRKDYWGESVVKDRRAQSAAAGGPAIIFEVPSGPQSFAEWVAFFGGGDRLFEVVYVVSDEEASWPAFQEILDTFTIIPAAASSGK